MTLQEIRKMQRKEPSKWEKYRELVNELMSDLGLNESQKITFWRDEFAIKQALGLIKPKGDEA